MSATSIHLVRGVTSEAEAVSDSDPFAPDAKLVWMFAQGRYATEEGVPLLTRTWARLDNARLRFWHRRLGQPKVSREDRLVLPLFRVGHFTRASARALCRTGKDYIWAIPADTAPLDAGIGPNPTLCRPLAEPEKDAIHAALYTADLRDFINAELHEENKRMREELEAVYRLSPLAEELIRKCERL